MRTDPHRLSLIARCSPLIERQPSMIQRQLPLIELVEITQPAAAESGLDSGARSARARSTSGPRIRRPAQIERRSPLIELVEVTPSLIERRSSLIELVEITPSLIERRSPLIELVEITPPQTLQPARNARQHRGMTACFAP